MRRLIWTLAWVIRQKATIKKIWRYDLVLDGTKKIGDNRYQSLELIKKDKVKNFQVFHLEEGRGKRVTSIDNNRIYIYFREVLVWKQFFILTKPGFSMEVSLI